jgi:hypothetical protein
LKDVGAEVASCWADSASGAKAISPTRVDNANAFLSIL